MRILLVAANSSYTRQLKRGFEKNGAEVFYLEERSNFLVPTFLRENVFLWKTLRKISRLRKLNNKIFGKNLIKTVLNFRPDLVFFSKAMIVKLDALIELRRLGFRTANWITDNIFHPRYKKWFIENHKYYAYLFVFDSGAKELVKNDPESKNVIYMPMAVEPEAYQLKKLTSEDRKKYETNVCFVGALYPERERALNAVKDLGLKIYGWKGWEKSSLARYYHGPLNVPEMVKLYNCAKICINMNLEPACNGVNWKTFEIPAAGGFQLTDYRKDLDGLFKIGEELDVFRSPEELRKKALFYLQNDELRRKIAQKGRERVLRNHTFEKRIKDILNTIR